MRYLIFLCLLCAGCSSQSNFSTTKLGNKVLELTGILPATRTFEAARGLGDSTVSLTSEQEYYLGRAVAARIISIYPVSDDKKLTSYLNLVGQAVLASTDAPESFSGYHFAVLDSQEFNAISAPSGFIFVSKTMIEKMPDEDALASVLAHEIAHVQLRHGLRSISKKRMDSIVKDLGRLAGSLQCNELLQGTAGVFSGVVGDLVENLVQKGYSREQELEADGVAVRFLGTSGYSPFSIKEMLAILEHQTKLAPQGGWFSTHPAAADRSLAVDTTLASYDKTLGKRGKTSRQQRFDAVVRNNDEAQASSPADAEKWH